MTATRGGTDWRDAEALVALRVDRAIAGRFQRHNRAADGDEMASLARLAFCRAAPLFDRKRGVRFGTFASRFAVHAICDYLKRERRRRARPTVSYDLPLSPGEPDTLADTLPDPAPGPEAAVVACLRDAAVRQVVESVLEGRELYLLRAVYWDGQTVADVARRFGVSPTRGQQIQARALRRLRESGRLEAWR